jgi:hypothetical protein
MVWSEVVGFAVTTRSSVDLDFGIMVEPRSSGVEVFAGVLPEEVHTVFWKSVQGDGPRYRACVHTTALIPALLRVCNDGRRFLLGVGKHDVHLAYLHTEIASDTKLLIESDREDLSAGHEPFSPR